jgi:hypothetical protein
MGRFKALFTALLFLPLTALAQTPPSDGTVRIITEPGQVVRAYYPDGGVAKVLAYMGPSTFISGPMKISESNCVSLNEDPNCRIGTYLSLNILTAVWEKNPDSTRVGKPIESEVLLTTDLNRSADRSDTPPSQLKCDNYAWVTPPSFTDADHFTIREWYSESMTPNFETGITENRITSGAIGLTWKKNGDHYDIQKLVGFIGNTKSAVYPLIGDVITLQMPKDGDICFTAFKPDIASLQKQLAAVIGDPTQITDFKDYIYKKDGLFDHSRMQDDLKQVR